MPWLALGALGFVAGLVYVFTRDGQRPVVVTRAPSQNPLVPNRPQLPPPPPLQPISPAPGVAPGMVNATHATERVHDGTRPMSPPAVTTTEPIDATPVSSVPGLVRSEPEPRRPRVPPAIRHAQEREAAIARAANPEVVEEHASGALGALRSSAIAPTARAAFVRRFQDAYGQGLAADGEYGPRTRAALAEILGMNPGELPPLSR